MTMTLDHRVSMSLAQARTLERAVHDRGTWTIRIGNQTSYAERVLMPDGVQFTAWFSPTDETEAWLYLDDEPVSVRAVDPVLDEDFGLQWVFDVTATIPTR